MGKGHTFLEATHATWRGFFMHILFIAQFVLVQKGKASGGKIGVTGGCPITVTLIRHLFLFRGESPGETSPVTWGFEKAKVEVSRKVIPSHKSHRSESPKGLTK
jgi:hypothetical protein